MLILEIALGLVLGVILLNLIFTPGFWVFLGGVLFLGIILIFWSEIVSFLEIVFILIFILIAVLCVIGLIGKSKEFLKQKKHQNLSQNINIIESEQTTTTQKEQ